VSWVTNVGVRSGTGAEIGSLRASEALVAGTGASLSFFRDSRVSLELEGERWLRNKGERGARPGEVLGALHQRIGPLGLAAGLGTAVGGGIGAPDARVVGRIGYEPRHDD
jgi:hypothetical protein